MTSRSCLAPLVAFGLVIPAVAASTAPEDPWLVGRTEPRWGDAVPSAWPK